MNYSRRSPSTIALGKISCKLSNLPALSRVERTDLPTWSEQWSCCACCTQSSDEIMSHNRVHKTTIRFCRTSTGNQSELNVPDEHFGVANTNNALSSSSSLQEDQSKNYSAPSKLNLPDENFGVANTNHALPSSSSLQDDQPKDYSTGYTGIYLRTNQKYEAYIPTNKKHYLGHYTLAADAAMAHDKCSDQLGHTSRNFPSLAEYSSARKNESKERGVDVPRSEVVAYVNSMVSNVISAVANSTTESEQQSTSSPEKKQKDKTYHSNYTGVSLDKRCGNYAAYILHGKKRRHVGKYALAADAALACDVCLQQLGLTFTSNFANEAEYNNASSWESRERRMNVPYIDIVDHLESKVNQVVANINSQNNSEIAEEKDASPAASDINEVESLPQDEERDEEFANSQSDVDLDLVFDASPATSDINEGASLSNCLCSIITGQPCEWI